MCKACKMDPASEKVFRERQGAVEVEDFDNEPRYRKTKRKARKPRERTRPGCPGNDYNAHVYVWVVNKDRASYFYKYFGIDRYQSKTCCGCGKVVDSKDSEAYDKRNRKEYEKRYGGSNEFNVKRGEPVNWRDRRYRRVPSYKYWHFESYDEEYVEKRHEYFVRHGFSGYDLW